MNVTAKCTQIASFFRTQNQPELAKEYEQIACEEDIRPFKELIQDGAEYMESILVHHCKECTMEMSEQREIAMYTCSACRSRHTQKRIAELESARI